MPDYRLVRVDRREQAESLWRMALRRRWPDAIAYADASAVATALEFQPRRHQRRAAQPMRSDAAMYTCAVTLPADLRRRVSQWRAAERRERALRTREAPVPPETALAAAADLFDWWTAQARGDADPVRAREDATARAAWRAVRERMGCLPPPPR